VLQNHRRRGTRSGSSESCVCRSSVVVLHCTSAFEFRWCSFDFGRFLIGIPSASGLLLAKRCSREGAVNVLRGQLGVRFDGTDRAEISLLGSIGCFDNVINVLNQGNLSYDRAATRCELRRRPTRKPWFPRSGAVGCKHAHCRRGVEASISIACSIHIKSTPLSDRFLACLRARLGFGLVVLHVSPSLFVVPLHRGATRGEVESR